MRLGEAWLSTDPMDPEVHWPPGLLPLDPPLPVEAGEDIRVRLQRPARGDWTWTVTAASGHRRHSSFLARADGARRLGRMAPAHRAFLNRRGDEALQILELMRQGRSNEEIAEILAGEAPAPAPAIDDALLRVQALALRYGKQD